MVCLMKHLSVITSGGIHADILVLHNAMLETINTCLTNQNVVSKTPEMRPINILCYLSGIHSEVSPNKPTQNCLTRSGHVIDIRVVVFADTSDKN